MAQDLTGAIAVAVVGVQRSSGASGFDRVGLILSGLVLPFGRLPVALNGLRLTRVALRAAMRAIGDPANLPNSRQAALDAAGNVSAAIRAGAPGAQSAAARGRPGRRATGVERCDPCRTAAHSIAVRVGRLPATQPIEPIALGRILAALAAALRNGLPPDPSERAAVVTAVFDEQLRSEHDWQTLVRSLAPRCLGPGQADLALAGLDLLRGSPRHLAVIDRPRVSFPDERVSLARIAANVDRFNGVVDDTLYRLRRFGSDVGRFARQTGADQLAREAFVAGQDAAAEAVQFAHDEDLVARGRQEFSDFLRDRRTSASPQSLQGQAPPPQSLPAIAGLVQRIYPNVRTRGRFVKPSSSSLACSASGRTSSRGTRTPAWSSTRNSSTVSTTSSTRRTPPPRSTRGARPDPPDSRAAVYPVQLDK